jgi:hypothetical protein
VKALFQGLRARLNERSTYMFFIGSLGTVSAFPAPFNWIGGAVLAVAALVPDGPVKPGQGE